MIGKALESGWTTLRENGWRLFGVSLLYVGFALLALIAGWVIVGAIWAGSDPEAFSELISKIQSLESLEYESPEIPAPIEFSLQLLVNVLTSLFLGGFYAAFLAAVRGEPFGVGILFSRMGDFWKYLVAHFVVSLVFGLGLLFFVLPGIYLGVRLSFYPFAIADGNGVFDAPFTVSWLATQKRFWTVFGFYAALVGLGLLFPVGIGMMIFIGDFLPFLLPVIFLFAVLGGIAYFLYAVAATASLYTQLLEEKGILPARADSSPF
ncbi:MAG: hypothetical protein KM296_07175 [Brockia lithotrophica]|nr:hypothetical protein [Brockia lithotrophica]